MIVRAELVIGGARIHLEVNENGDGHGGDPRSAHHHALEAARLLERIVIVGERAAGRPIIDIREIRQP